MFKAKEVQIFFTRTFLITVHLLLQKLYYLLKIFTLGALHYYQKKENVKFGYLYEVTYNIILYMFYFI